MIKRYSRQVVAAAFVSVALSSNATAASQDECAIWICLPGGFPAGCAAAHAAMIKRLTKLKPPLPAFGSCAVGGGNMTSTFRPAALIAERQVCSDYRQMKDIRECIAWKTIPQHYLKGVACRKTDAGEHPEGCITTYRYVEVFENGKQVGETYFFKL